MKEGAQRESVSKKSNKKILRAEKELKIECQGGYYEARRSGAKKTPREPARGVGRTTKSLKKSTPTAAIKSDQDKKYEGIIADGSVPTSGIGADNSDKKHI